jgi:ADP-ribosylglycohydrolase
MIGAIAGDIIGSIYEFNNIQTKEFPLFTPNSFFTDDTILSVAVAEVILTHDPIQSSDYVRALKKYAKNYPREDYGVRFRHWVSSDDAQPYNSWGNGSAMRVSPVGFAFDDIATVLKEAELSAAVTHNHPEGIKGAKATASAIFWGRNGASKTTIKRYIEENFGYNLNQTLDEIRPNYQFNESSQDTVPQAIIAFLESTDFEDAVRNAVSLGGDTDTLTCITGGIAEAFYGGVPDHIMRETLDRLDDHLRTITLKFCHKYNISLSSYEK